MGEFTGGRFSETLGFDHLSCEAVRFRFRYPTAPFRATFRWCSTKSVAMEQEDKEQKPDLSSFFKPAVVMPRSK
jgi:hypothetical protein